MATRRVWIGHRKIPMSYGLRPLAVIISDSPGATTTSTAILPCEVFARLQGTRKAILKPLQLCIQMWPRCYRRAVTVSSVILKAGYLVLTPALKDCNLYRRC